MKLINVLSIAFVLFMSGNVNSTQVSMDFTNSFCCLVRCFYANDLS